METLVGTIKQVVAQTPPASQAALPKISLKFDGGPLRELPDSCLEARPHDVPERLRAEFQRACDDQRWPIYLHGLAGRGKSCAMACLYALWPTKRALWFDTSVLLRKIMRCRMSDGGCIYETADDGCSYQVFESQIMERVQVAHLCCFDDVGLRSPSDAMYDAWYDVINRRKRLPTVFTGNLAPEELHKVYDSRIASRLTRGTVIELTGSDRRLSETRIVKI